MMRLSAFILLILTVQQFHIQHAEAAGTKNRIIAFPEALLSDDIQPEYSRIVTDRLLETFKASGRFEIKSDDDIKKITSGTGCKDDERCLINIGSMIKADYITSTRMELTGSRYRITVRIIKTNSGKSISSRSETANNSGEITKKALNIANAVLSDMPLEGTITKSEWSNVHIDIGAAKGVKNGDEFLITRELPGKNENDGTVSTSINEIGRIIIIEVKNDFSIGKVKEGETFQAGDIATLDENARLRQKDYTQQLLKELKKENRANPEAIENRRTFHLELKAGGGIAEMKDPLMSDLFGTGSLASAEIFTGYKYLGIFTRYSQRNFEMKKSVLDKPVAIENGILTTSEIDIKTFDAGGRFSIGPDFEWLAIQFYIPISYRTDWYTEKNSSGDELKITTGGLMYGAGIQLIFFDIAGIYTEYNRGTCTVGEKDGKRNIEGNQITVGAVIKI